LNGDGAVATSLAMPAPPPPEVIRVSTVQVACDGSGEISPALGHPRVFLRIDPEVGFVECGYCDRRFVLEEGPADQKAA
jgi:NADH dehydrogenase (ubiquinone) Fe-S protein 6